MRLALVIALVACHSSTTPVQPQPPKPLSRAAYAHYLEAKMAMYQRDWGAATVALAEARKAAPDEPMIVVALAHAQWKAKDAKAARITLEAARKQWPDHGELWVASADLFASDSATQVEAATMYRRAVALLPDDERGYLGLAKVEPDKAEATLRTLVKRVPTSVDGHYRLAVMLAKRDEYEAAVPELRAVLERDPDHIDARLDLARVLRRTNHLDEAVMQTRSAFDRAAQPLDVAEELFWLLVEIDDRTGAIDLLTLLDDDRSDIEALATIARLDRGLGRLDEARAIAEKVARQDSDAGAITLAEAEQAAGDSAAALVRLSKIADASEHAILARRTQAEILLATGEPAKVGPVTAAIRSQHPKELELAVLAAFALVDQQQVQEAKNLLAPFGETPDARYARARLLERAGDRAGALALLLQIVVAEPDAVGPRNLAGYILVEQNQLPAARVQLHKARQLSPGDPSILDSWGFLLLREGKTDEAIRTLAKAHRYAPREPEILAHLAEAWLARKAPVTAREFLDAAAALHPTPAIRAKIERTRQALAGGR